MSNGKSLGVIQQDEHFTEYCKVPVLVLKRYGTAFPFDLYLKLSSNKIVKVHNKQDCAQELFDKYGERGVEHIFIQHDCFKKFIREYNEKLKLNLFSKLSEEQKVLTLEEAYSFVASAFKGLSFNETAIYLAAQITQNSIQIISSQKNILTFFKEYQDTCNKEFLKTMMTAYATNIMIGTFMWQSQSIREKATLGCILKDVLMKYEDYELIRTCKGNKEELPERVKNHGLDICKTIKQNNKEWLAQESQTIIEQHHELPDGSGFPYGFEHPRITLLSAIHIVAQNFIERLSNYDYDPKMRQKVLNNMKSLFNVGHYKTAMGTLGSVMGILLEIEGPLD